MPYRVDRSGRGGFTLLEIMIALAILGIVVVLAVGNFQGMMEKYRVEGETKQMFADLMDARGRAMQRNRAFFVRINANGYGTFEDTSPAPDGNGSWESADAPAANEVVRHTITHRARRAFGFPLQPERDRLRDRNHPVRLDRAAGLRLHHRPGDPDQNGADQCRYLCRKIANRG